MKKELIIEKAELVHKLYMAQEITYEVAIQRLEACGYKDLFNKISKRSAEKFGVKHKPFSAWHFLHSKIIYHS